MAVGACHRNQGAGGVAGCPSTFDRRPASQGNRLRLDGASRWHQTILIPCCAPLAHCRMKTPESGCFSKRIESARMFILLGELS